MSAPEDHRESQDESFPHSYRFVPIPPAPGWTTYPGQQCHEDQDGLRLEDCESRWWEQDLWGAYDERFYLYIGCYAGEHEYVCEAEERVPDDHGKMLERVAFRRADEAAGWALAWMAEPQPRRARPR